jgi:hypothetical protein
MELDNPLTRAGTTCPLCSKAKDAGCVACWPCYRRFELKYGNQTAEAVIDSYETRLRLSARF